MTRCAILLAAFFTLSLTGFAQETKGPLADLPSKPGTHVEKIKSLGDISPTIPTGRSSLS